MKKRIFSILLAISMILSMMPVSAFATPFDGLCEHHPSHTPECGYAEKEEGEHCDFWCDFCDIPAELMPRQEHAICGSASCDHADDHPTASFNPLVTIDNIALSNGYYYLGRNMPITHTLEIRDNVVLCLNGRTLRCDEGMTGPMFRIGPGGSLTICDCSEEGNGKLMGSGEAEDSSMIVVAGGTLNLYGGTISGGNAQQGGGVYVIKDNLPGIFNMYGGTISGNTAESGGGVYVTENRGNSIFNMYGGTISGNTAKNGGGVCLFSEDAYNGFYMYGGTISGNTAEKGGGLYVNKSESMIESGQIHSNAAQLGGGMYFGDGTLIMHEASIRNNTASSKGGGMYLAGGLCFIEGECAMAISGNTSEGDGGGLYVEGGTLAMYSPLCMIQDNVSGAYGGGLAVTGGDVSMEAGTISGNHSTYDGGGVYVNYGDNTTFTVSGGTVAENTKGADRPSNVYVKGGAPITVGSFWDTNSMIYVDHGIGTVFTNKGVPEGAEQFFRSSNGDLAVQRVTGEDGDVLKVVVNVETLPAHSHKACGVPAEEDCGHGHKDAVYELLTDGTITEINEAKNYYLLADLELAEAVTIRGDVTLCLNGFTLNLRNNRSGPAFLLEEGGTLTLCDCTGAGMVIGNGAHFVSDDDRLFSYDVEFKVTDAPHSHSGGTATCQTPAVCAYCGESYGSPDASKHVVSAFSASENVITASCSECGQEAGSLTLMTSQGIVYDGTELDGTWVEGSIPGVNVPEIVYSGDRVNVTEEGFCASITLGDATAVLNVTIQPREIYVISATVYGGSYGDGLIGAYDVVLEGVLEGDEVYFNPQYAIPESSEIGTYTNIRGLVGGSFSGEDGANYCLPAKIDNTYIPATDGINGYYSITSRDVYIIVHDQEVAEGQEIDPNGYAVVDYYEETPVEGFTFSGITLVVNENDEIEVLRDEDWNVIVTVTNEDGEDVTDCFEFYVSEPGKITRTHEGHSLNADGFCETNAACRLYDVPDFNEELYAYEITNAGQLYWFAAYINNENSSASAILMNDIAVPTGAPQWQPMMNFYGEFDGNFKTLSGLNVSGSEYVGVFGGGSYAYGTIRNLHISNSTFTGISYVGGIAGDHSGSIENCYVDGTVTVSGENYVGGLVGSMSGSWVLNCYAYADSLVGNYHSDYTEIINSYYLSEAETEDGGRTAEQFANGEVAYLLQAGQEPEYEYDEDWNAIPIPGTEPHIWGQTIGSDPYPIFGGEKVYQGYTDCDLFHDYANDADISQEPLPHTGVLVFTPNDDGTTHQAAYDCCGTVAAESEIHDTFDSVTGQCKCGAFIAAAQIDGVYYGTLEAALTDWTDGKTLVLTNDVTHDSELEVIEKSVILDLNGKTLTLGDYAIRVGSEIITDMENEPIWGNLTIRDSGEGGTISASFRAFMVYGTMVLESGTVGAQVRVTEHGTLNMTGGTIQCTENTSGVENNGQLHLSGGVIIGRFAVKNEGTAVISGSPVLTGSDYGAKNPGAAIRNNGSMTISGSPLLTGGGFGTIVVYKPITLNTQPAAGEVWQIFGEGSQVAAIPGKGVTLDPARFALADKVAAGYELCLNADGSLVLCSHTGETMTCMGYVCDFCGNLFGEGDETTHSYDTDCDEVCNFCGLEREAGDHTFVNGKCECGAPCEHIWGEWEVCILPIFNMVSPSEHKHSCTVCGLEERAAHTLEYHTTWPGIGTHIKICVDCGYKEERLRCNGGTATCTEKAICKDCGDRYGSLADHSYENGICTVCGAECEHRYDYVCDAECNACGSIREAAAHTYEYDCDTQCSECAAVTRPEAAHATDSYPCMDGLCRYGCGTEMGATAEHTYGFACDADCDVCGTAREAGDHTFVDGKCECGVALGSSDYPAEAKLGDNLAVLAEGDSGYCLRYIAEKDGELIVTISGEENWSYQITNLTAKVWGDTQWSDSEPVVNPAVVPVSAGDELIITVSGYNPLSFWESPAANLTVTLEYAPEVFEIVRQPVSVVGTIGETVSVSVEATGEGLTYQWYIRNGTGAWSVSSITTPVYEVVMNKSRANRELYCIITDANGNTLKTDVVSMIGQPTQELAILTQPGNASAKLGEGYCVTVEAQGDRITYQWYFRQAGETRWNQSGVRDNTYDDVMTSGRHNREVYCVITDAWGNSLSTEVAKLTALPEIALEITRQPEDVSAKLGETFAVTLEAQGQGLRYTWYWRQAGATAWNISGQKDNTYDAEMNASRHNRQVYCVITDAFGNTVTSETATITGAPEVTLEITKQPEDQTVTLGERFNVTVEASGDGIRYQWFFCNAGSTVWTPSSQKDNSYDDVMTGARHNRKLYCVVTDSWGNTVTTDPVVVIMAKPMHELEITAQPENTAVQMDERFCVTVEAQGDGLKYQWYWRNIGSETWQLSGQRDNSYDDVMTKARHNREVYCVITDMWGERVETDVATIKATPNEVLELLAQPTDAYAAMGETYCVTVAAQGDGLTYTWYFRNGGTGTWHKSGVTDNTYDDVMIKSRAGREVYCVVTDLWGNSVTTDTVTLICTEVPQAIIAE